MKIVTANGKRKLVMSKTEWKGVGREAGWSKKASTPFFSQYEKTNQSPAEKLYDGLVKSEAWSEMANAGLNDPSSSHLRMTFIHALAPELKKICKQVAETKAQDLGSTMDDFLNALNRTPGASVFYTTEFHELLAKTLMMFKIFQTQEVSPSLKA